MFLCPCAELQFISFVALLYIYQAICHIHLIFLLSIFMISHTASAHYLFTSLFYSNLASQSFYFIYPQSMHSLICRLLSFPVIPVSPPPSISHASLFLLYAFTHTLFFFISVSLLFQHFLPSLFPFFCLSCSFFTLSFLTLLSSPYLLFHLFPPPLSFSPSHFLSLLFIIFLSCHHASVAHVFCVFQFFIYFSPFIIPHVLPIPPYPPLCLACHSPTLCFCADYSKGFGGKFGVQSDRQDKCAAGWDHVEKVEKHESQKGEREKEREWERHTLRGFCFLFYSCPQASSLPVKTLNNRQKINQ